MPSPVVLYAGRAIQREFYVRHLSDAFRQQGLDVRLVADPAEVAPEQVAYLVFAGNGPVTRFAPFTGLRAILNLWAGVESVLRMDLPPGVPLVRMIEDGLTIGMVDYVCGHVLRHHLDIDRYISTDPIAEWETDYPPLARDRTVGILGTGTLGTACARALAGHGFDVLGWSRSRREIEGVACHAGPAGLDVVLARAEIAVLLLPLTAETERMLDGPALARMPRGACLINAGRGPLIDHPALLAALDRGHIRHATMDVFDEEPLPPEHPYWRHPRVTVTPHIASVTRPETASTAIAANIARDLAGEAMVGVVDRDRGY